ncbi:tripartite tricarboxylate transporter permease [Pseudogemmobacter sonorensis]|uniref:tripartite tricarboxylate transporter permease n=1 Tax=Pseudogemmobacter sonorensis TaxID=2989681 RepID=UPI00369969F4
MDTLANVGLGLATAMQPANLFYCFLGVFLGMLVGVIPGIGVLSAISMLFPLTFYLDPVTALIMLAGIWYGTGYGGRTASILLNIPGTVANAVTCLDGYPMTKQGRGGVALLLTTLASFVGGSIGIVLLMMFAPVIAGYAMDFGSAEYFSLMVLGLVAASTISEGSAVKGLAMVVLGIMLGTVGTDIYSGIPRFNFGMLSLADGINLIALAMGMFGVAEVISSIGKVESGSVDPESVKLRAMKPTGDDMRRSWMPMLRGSGIGAFFGTLPGTGPAVASFLSYAVEKRVAEDPTRFGKGAVEGIMAPEAADNSAEMTSFIPTLSLGIPGSATMALMLGVLMIHGIAPGPALMSEQPSLFWGLIMSFWIGNVILVILNVPLIGIWVRMLMIPYHLLFPAVLVFICIGTYGISSSTSHIWVVLVFGLAGYLMRILDWPAAPLLLGFVLGPLMEEHFRRAMRLSRGSFSTFVERPISATVLVLTVLVLLWGLRSWLRQKQRVRALSRD